MYLVRRYEDKCGGNYKCQLHLTVACFLQLFLLLFYWRSHCGVDRTHFRPMPTYSDVLSDNTSELQVERRRTGCSLPQGGYKAWRQNGVTNMRPQIPRDCTLLFRGDSGEVERVRQANQVWNSAQFDSEFYDMAIFGSCSMIRSEFLDNLYVTKDEQDFPLAFQINVHDYPQQIFRFLKVIYRPHNLYCLNYDSKSSNKVKRAIENLAKCLGNVIMPKAVVNMVRGCSTIMEAQVNCMKALYSVRSPSYPWKYTITLCGKELPLRTNGEIVKILKRYNGTSAIQLYAMAEWEQRERFTNKFVIGSDNRCYVTHQKLGPVPYSVKFKKSMAYFALTREFIYFLLHNETSLELYEYMKGVSNSEEHYFSTVYSIAGKVYMTLYIHCI